MGTRGVYLSLRFSLPINPIESRSRVARPKPFLLRWENQRRLGTSQECTQCEYFSSIFFSLGCKKLHKISEGSRDRDVFGWTILRVSKDLLFYNWDDYLTTKSASQEDHDIIAKWSRTRDEESNSSAKRILQKQNNSLCKPVLKLAGVCWCCD